MTHDSSFPASNFMSLLGATELLLLLLQQTNKATHLDLTAHNVNFLKICTQNLLSKLCKLLFSSANCPNHAFEFKRI